MVFLWTPILAAAKLNALATLPTALRVYSELASGPIPVGPGASGLGLWPGGGGGGVGGGGGDGGALLGPLP